jgi:hypothetical protein
MEGDDALESETGQRQALLHAKTRILCGLRDAVYDLEAAAGLLDDINNAARRGFFAPGEDERIWAWFSRFLSVREGLWEIVDAVSRDLDNDFCQIQTTEEWRQAVLGFTAATLLVRMDKLLIEQVAINPLTQRKLNEACPLYRIPRKQYTHIFESLTNPDNALLLLQAFNFSRANRRKLAALANDDGVGEFVRELPELEKSIDPGIIRYLFRRLRYRWHALRRRGASARQKSVFRLLEAGGRIVAEIGDSHSPNRVGAVIDQIEEIVQPGDVFITRHDFAASNLFLPGFWPHAALYIGSEQDRVRMGVEVSEERRKRWRGDKCILEADKEGVLFRSLRQTLAVDSLVVLRPRCTQDQLAIAISRACTHEGKGYNFDFDFFRSDRLVCTEVIYRAFDGIGRMRFVLGEHAGCHALSAEEILDLALVGEMFTPVVLFGVPGCNDSLCLGAELNELLERSFHANPAQLPPRLPS